MTISELLNLISASSGMSNRVGLDMYIFILSIVKITLSTFGPHSSTFTTLSGCLTMLSNVLQPDDRLRIVPKPYFVSMCLSGSSALPYLSVGFKFNFHFLNISSLAVFKLKYRSF